MKQPCQRSGQHAFDRMDMVAARHQRAHAAQHRQPRSHGGAIAVVRTAGVTRRVQGLRPRQRGTLAQLVGSDHMHAAQQPLRMPIGNDLAGGRIHQHIAGTQGSGFRPGLQHGLATRRGIGLLQGLCGAGAAIVGNTRVGQPVKARQLQLALLQRGVARHERAPHRPGAQQGQPWCRRHRCRRSAARNRQHSAHASTCLRLALVSVASARARPARRSINRSSADSIPIDKRSRPSEIPPQRGLRRSSPHASSRPDVRSGFPHRPATRPG